MIYLASPYSHKDPEIREQRFQSVCKHAARLMRQGHTVLSPIAHSHPIAQYDLPKDWNFWKNQDEEMMKACDVVYVLMIDGWQESIGVTAEIQWAKENNIPVVYMLEQV
jgi:nucleoside 2-deoxyribosyltransferase